MQLKLTIYAVIVLFGNNSFASDTFKNISCENTEPFNVFISYKEERYEKTINGCLTDKEAIALSLQSRIFDLKPGFFRDMIKLETIGLQNDNLKNLEPGFIINSPNLKNIYASSNFIQHIKRNVFNGMNLERLILNSNRIYKISECAFANTNVSRLDLANNKLTSVRENWFYNTFIQKLELHYNRISSLEGSIFDEIKNLSSINLNYNMISFIDDECFSGQQHLTELYLAGNQIMRLDFINGMTVNILDIGFNKIGFVLLQNSTEVNQILIHPNPWICECLTEFWRYAWQKNIQYGTSITSRSFVEMGKIPLCFAKEKECNHEHDQSLTRRYFHFVNYHNFGSYIYDVYT